MEQTECYRQRCLNPAKQTDHVKHSESSRVTLCRIVNSRSILFLDISPVVTGDHPGVVVAPLHGSHLQYQSIMFIV